MAHMPSRRTIDHLVLRTRNRARGALELAALRRSGPDAVAYVGYTVGGNLGDDACLAAGRELLEGAHLSDWCVSATTAPRLRPQVGAVMLGGGTLVGRRGFLAHLETVRTVPSAPSFAIGVGVEDPESETWGLTDRRTEEAWIPHLAAMSQLSVRGPRSAEILRDRYGISAPVSGDLALALTPPATEPRERLLGICLAAPADGMWGGSVERMVEATLHAARVLLGAGWDLRLFTAWPTRDRSLTTEVARRIGAPGRVTVSTASSSEMFMVEAGRCTVLLGARLHSVVLAALAGVPSVALAYRPKTEDFMASIGRSEFCVRTSDVEGGGLVETIVALSDQHDRHAADQSAAIGTLRRALRTEAARIRTTLP